MRPWLSALASALRSFARPGRAVVKSVRTVAGSERPPGVASVSAARIALAVGAGALLVGAAARLGLAFAQGLPLAPAAAGVVATVAWAVARYAVLSVTRSGRPQVQADAVAYAWGRGSLPYAVAISGTARTAAFAASAVLTYRSLMSSGASRGKALAMCGWAFGAEAAAALAGWLVTNGLILLPLLG